MIGRLTGTLLENHPPVIVIEVGGIGYELNVPISTFCELPSLGSTVVLYVHQVIREDTHLLYGFGTRVERDVFRELIKVSGIGPKIGLAVLSGMSTDALVLAIAQKDASQLEKIPGIGKKTAERVVLELTGKLHHCTGITPTYLLQATAKSASQDILHALIALGYAEREAKMALAPISPEVSVSEGIKLALKSLAKC